MRALHTQKKQHTTGSKKPNRLKVCEKLMRSVVILQITF